MNTGITTNLPVQWLPAARIIRFQVTVTAGAPSPDALVCYEAQNALFGDES